MCLAEVTAIAITIAACSGYISGPQGPHYWYHYCGCHSIFSSRGSAANALEEEDYTVGGFVRKGNAMRHIGLSDEG